MDSYKIKDNSIVIISSNKVNNYQQCSAIVKHHDELHSEVFVWQILDNRTGQNLAPQHTIINPLKLSSQEIIKIL